jgi:iron complex outermembrane receptor protein
LRFKPNSHDTFGVQAAGNDPTYQLSLRSSMNPVDHWELDLALRSIDHLPNPHVPGYVALDGRIGWNVSNAVELSLIGFNLLDRRHPEFVAASSHSELARSVYLKLRWSF